LIFKDRKIKILNKKGNTTINPKRKKKNNEINSKNIFKV
jgi:hypothetical protein